MSQNTGLLCHKEKTVIMTKKIHYFAGITISLFVGIHLLNHLALLFGEQAHISFMNGARLIYRSLIGELLLLLAVFVQIVSGIRLVRQMWKSKSKAIFHRLHLYSGLYLSFFLIMHTLATVGGRYFLSVDTNIYYGASVVVSMPHRIFYLPYYALSVISFFAHIACIHRIKVRQFNLSETTATQHAQVIIATGFLITILIIWKMLGVEVPSEYMQLLGAN